MLEVVVDGVMGLTDGGGEVFVDLLVFVGILSIFLGVGVLVLAFVGFVGLEVVLIEYFGEGFFLELVF